MLLPLSARSMDQSVSSNKWSENHCNHVAAALALAYFGPFSELAIIHSSTPLFKKNAPLLQSINHKLYTLLILLLSAAMSSILCSQGMVLATAMAVSSTIVLLAFCSQKALSITRFSFEHNCGSTSQILRSCISSGARKRNKTKKKKRVHFALDVVEPTSNGEEFRRNPMSSCRSSRSSSTSVRYTATGQVCRQSKIYGLRENHMALYNGVLRDRGQRMVCLY